MVQRHLTYILTCLLVAGCLISSQPTVQASPSSETLPALGTSTISGSSLNIYYVSTAGDDGNDGSLDHPWATLQHAVNQVIPGDTIFVLSGTYQGCRIERSGTPTGWITLKSAPGATVIINSPGPNNRHDSNIEVETWDGSGTVSYWLIEGFEVAYAPAWGIDIRGNEDSKSAHITIRNNVVHDNGLTTGTTGIFAAFTDYVVIENNHSYLNGEHGIYVNNSSDHFLIRGNTLDHNQGCGIHLNGDASMGGDGIMSNGLVEKNIIFENGYQGGAGINMDGVIETTIQNNLLYQNHASGIAIYQIDGAVCSRENLILHNTIHMAEDGRWAITISSADCIDNQLLNNILLSDNLSRGSISLLEYPINGLVSNYNRTTDFFTTDDGATRISLAEWQGLGLDLNTQVALPSDLFVNFPMADYHLIPEASAINQGLHNSLTEDLDGIHRPSGTGYDIGAFEFQEGDPPIVWWTYLPYLINISNP